MRNFDNYGPESMLNAINESKYGGEAEKLNGGPVSDQQLLNVINRYYANQLK